ncbi:MAG TPA: hypothetical protein PKU87_01155 [Candidatus Atribacteria bacterium]|mgnify:CR=1 FL=1|nr:hypothetical protein [Candidatus Atribacteria bacterium]
MPQSIHCLCFRPNVWEEVELNDWALLTREKVEPVINITSEKAVIENRKIGRKTF